MANLYRQYLISEKGMKKADMAPSLNLHIYGAVDTKTNTLGVPHQTLTGLTSFTQAQDMAAELRKAGTRRIDDALRWLDKLRRIE